MAEYLIMLWHDEDALDATSPEEQTETYRAHLGFQEKHGGAIRGGNRLHRTSSATSIRRGADGVTTVTDGAFAETKEAICGYYLVDAPDLDAALQIAEEVPAGHGGVEVRPIWPSP